MIQLRATALEALDEDAALERLHRDGCTDGLPVVVPTPERVERMLVHGAGLDPDVIVAEVAPAYGEATVEKVAINAVMAGCPPECFRVVLAAVAAVCDPVFNLGPVQLTTHDAAPFLVVNGPIREECQISSGTGALGAGHRANASIGRALRLVLMNIGGGRPGTGDMAQLGHPGKFSYCMGEAEEQSPFEPLHVTRGLAREQSAVTALAAEAPHSVFMIIDPDDPHSADRLLRITAAALANVGANNVYLGAGMVGVVLNPEHGRVLAAAGLSKADVQAGIFERAVQRRATLRELQGDFVPVGDGDDEMRVVASPEDIMVVVGGGGGLYSAVLPTWGAGPAGCVAVTREVRGDLACDIPVSTS